VKATILAALLRRAMEERRNLTRSERNLATAMITRSDNGAASALWNEVGHSGINHFLRLAGMSETVLGSGGLWGLTQITARDETTLLILLTQHGSVLTDSSRAYELGLMQNVISSQRWGVPAGASRNVTVYVKNGWVPISPHGWRVNSIGAFSGHRRDYMIVVLTEDNSTMAYGVGTIENIAEVIHRDLKGGTAAAPAAIPMSSPNPTWEQPDEQLPPGTTAP
jgi:hypothetical protein